MSDWSLMRIIVGREYRAWRKPFLISSAVILTVVAAGLMLASTIADTTGQATYAMALAGDTPPSFSATVDGFLPEEIEVAVVRVADAEEAEAATQRGDVAVAVVDDDTIIWGAGVPDPLGDSVVQALALAQMQSRAPAFGLSPADVSQLVTPDLTFIDTAPPSSDDEGSDEAIAVLATIIMFMAIIAYGQWIGYAVVEEKANRVVELLLGAIRPHQLMGAKVVSIGSLGLAQIAGVGILALAFGFATDGVGAPTVRVSTVAWVVLWFFLGYAFYGSLYAAAGSLASNTQEAGSTIGPLAIFLAIGYMSGLISFGEGYDTVWLQVISFIPLWSPLVMPGRIARGWALPWEMAVSVLIMVAAIYGMLRLAGWIYTGGVARATQKLGWREAFRAGRDLQSG